jgi:hypothetical protein
VHRDRAIADEQGTRDLAVAIPSDEHGQHFPLTASEVKRDVSRGWRAGGQPGPPGQFPGESQQGRRGKRPRQGVTRAEGTASLFAPSRANRCLGLTQARVGLPVRLADHMPCLGYGTPRRPTVSPALAFVLSGHEHAEGGHLMLPAAVRLGNGHGPVRERGRRLCPLVREPGRPYRRGQ